mmetsp:Transcript_72562/g.216546  ORF Transcript_72562/g.216546 Transcript_72562/m.216546 type:complete len:411 (-) Transcript_72562:43-1275(-)
MSLQRLWRRAQDPTDDLAPLARVAKTLGVCSVGTIALSLLGAFRIWTLVLALASEVVASLYYIVVVWNPSLRVLFRRRIGVSEAYRCCKNNPYERLDWGRLKAQASQVWSGRFYSEYHGHKAADLASVREVLRRNGCQSFIYLCGDSSLDNKHWFFARFRGKEDQMSDGSFTAPAVNGYDQVLENPPRMVQDVCFHLNDLAAERFGSGNVCTIMSAVEESTIEDREQEEPFVQDMFIRDHVTENDFVIVSMGGNDIALSPTLRTIVNMGMLLQCPDWLIRAGLAPGLGYFVKFFHGRIQRYLRGLLAHGKPKKVLVCMIYYPDPVPGGSWADHTLSLMGYDDNPAKLQLIIRTVYERIKARGFDVAGTVVEPFPLFEVLSEHSDFVQRVEPSVAGGRKMAAAFLEALFPR